MSVQHEQWLILACYGGLLFYAGLRLASWRIRKIVREEILNFHMWRLDDASEAGRQSVKADFDHWHQRHGLGG